MDVRELRIGNLVYPHEENATPWEIYGIAGAEVFFGKDRMNEDMWSPCEIIEPIPLTEEWLVKFGFKADGGFCWLDVERDGVYIAWDKEKKYCELLEGSGDGRRYGKPIQFIHSLQNIFFVLTGEELKLQYQQPA